MKKGVREEIDNKIRKFIKENKEDLSLFLACGRMKKSVGHSVHKWTSMNPMEVLSLLENIKAFTQWYEHIYDKGWDKKFQKGCRACRVAKRVLPKSKKLKVGSREYSEFIADKVFNTRY